MQFKQNEQDMLPQFKNNVIFHSCSWTIVRAINNIEDGRNIGVIYLLFPLAILVYSKSVLIYIYTQAIF